MRLYPDTADYRGRAVARDALTILALIVLAWLAIEVHNAVDELAVLGTGVRDSGEVVQNGLESAGDAVDGVPVVGGELGDALRDAGQGTGGEVADAGRRGEERVHDLADLTLPARIRQIRELNASGRLLDTSTEERRRLIAMRAAFSPPAPALARHTRDPIGDLAEGRYEPLIAAAYDEAGLKPRA